MAGREIRLQFFDTCKKGYIKLDSDHTGAWPYRRIEGILAIWNRFRLLSQSMI